MKSMLEETIKITGNEINIAESGFKTLTDRLASNSFIQELVTKLLKQTLFEKKPEHQLHRAEKKSLVNISAQSLSKFDSLIRDRFVYLESGKDFYPTNIMSGIEHGLCIAHSFSEFKDIQKPQMSQGAKKEVESNNHQRVHHNLHVDTQFSSIQQTDPGLQKLDDLRQ